MSPESWLYKLNCFYRIGVTIPQTTMGPNAITRAIGITGKEGSAGGGGKQQSIATARSKQETRFFVQSALNAMCMEVGVGM